MKRFFILLCCSAAFSASARTDKDTVTLKPYSIQQFGILIGESLTSYTLNFCGGIKYKQAKVGVGVALNGYMMRSMPLYLDLRYEFGKRNTRTFAFTGGGINLFPAYRNNDYHYYNNRILEKQVGTYGELGLGFKTRIGRELFYNTSFSYVYKKSRYIGDGQPYWNGVEWIDDNTEKVTIENGMVSLRVGLDF